jgi:hypothetical protein
LVFGLDLDVKTQNLKKFQKSKKFKIQKPKNPKSSPKKNPKIHEIKNPNPNPKSNFFWVWIFRFFKVLGFPSKNPNFFGFETLKILLNYGKMSFKNQITLQKWK